MSGIFKTAENMINEMIYEIASNQGILKYIVYDDVSVDSITLANITNPSDYIYSPEKPSPSDTRGFRLFPIPKIPNVEEQKKTFVSCYVVQTDAAGGNNPFFSDYNLCFDIISHIDTWCIAGGIIRPLRIADGINDIFVQKQSENSMKKLYPIRNTYIQWNNLFCGYRLIYSATNFNKSLCGV